MRGLIPKFLNYRRIYTYYRRLVRNFGLETWSAFLTPEIKFSDSDEKINTFNRRRESKRLKRNWTCYKLIDFFGIANKHFRFKIIITLTNVLLLILLRLSKSFWFIEIKTYSYFWIRYLWPFYDHFGINLRSFTD